MGTTDRGGLSRRGLLKGLGTAALAGTALGAGGFPRAASARAATRPNVVLVTADDLGQQLGCYGDRVTRTPNLDAFAREGVRFNRAYVTQASCSPSRSSMLTGLYPHQNGQVGLSNAGFRMRDGIRTLPAMLGDAGYRTGIVGKLHVAPESAFPWDYWARDAAGSQDGALIRDRCRQFVRGGSGPFFLMANYFDPHVVSGLPFHHQIHGLPARPHPPGSVAPFAFQGIDTPEVRERTRGYYNSVERLDAGIGMLMTMLESEGVLDNTLIIFVGDHGPPFSRAKTSSYEAGIKIPFLVRYPGRQWTGAVRGHKQVSTIDIVPTILEATGTRAPAGLPGRSLVRLLSEWQIPWRSSLVTEFTSHGAGDSATFPRRTIRGDQYKLIVNLAGRPNPLRSIDGDIAYTHSRRPQFVNTLQGRAMTRFGDPPAEELYDVVNDPHEFHDLARDPAQAGVLSRLRDLLAQWQEETDDPLRDRAATAPTGA